MVSRNVSSLEVHRVQLKLKLPVTDGDDQTWRWTRTRPGEMTGSIQMMRTSERSSCKIVDEDQGRILLTGLLFISLNFSRSGSDDVIPQERI